MSEWPAVDLALLAALWGTGLSTKKIGERIGRTKNSVVGKAHRLELPSRPSPINGGRPPLTIEERRERVVECERRKAILRKGPTLPPLPSQIAEPVVVYTVPRPVAIAQPAPRRMAPTTHRFELPPARPRPEPTARAAYAGISTCQFPRQEATEHGGTTWLFCDAPATRGAYCDPHGDACYLGRRRAVAEAVAA